ncbi:ATP-binding protein [Chitinophaga sp. 212800010-3]|uniref:tetratricopeptide repeat-containing sensor histidine kinase n=1 Tax=unclassified Chitinophaga TaxID=2619133 RepID=UPI002E0E1609
MSLFCRPNTYYLQPLLFVSFFYSCTTAPDDNLPEHKRYFDAIFLKKDTIEHINVDSAVNFMDSAYRAFRNPGPADMFRRYDYLRWYYLIPKHDLQLAMQYADSTLSLFRNEKFRQHHIREYGSALLSKGDVYRDQGKYSEAYLFYYQGWQAIQTTGDSCSYKDYSRRLGMIYYKQEKYVKAIPYFEKSFGEAQHCDPDVFLNYYFQQEMLDNIGLCYEYEGNYASAQLYYDSALRFINATGSKFNTSQFQISKNEAAKAVVHSNLGNILAKQHLFDAAEAAYKEGIRINLKEQYEIRDAQKTMARMAQLYLSQNRLRDAGKILGEMRSSMDKVPGPAADEQARKVRSDEIELLWRRMEWQYLDQSGQTAAAFNMLKSFNQLNDSLINLNNPVLPDASDEIEHISREFHLSGVEKDNALKTSYLIILSILFIGFVLVTWMIWHNWRKSRKHLAALKLLNQQVLMEHENVRQGLKALEQSQKDNSRILKIVAHDLRSPIGAIQSLAELMLASRQLADRDAELIDLIRSSSADALILISDLMTLDRGIADVEKETVELHTVLKNCVDIQQVLANEKKQEITLETVPVAVTGYREKLWRVFSNVIGNAIKFSPQGSVILVRMNCEEAVVTVSVEDHGIGIPENLQSKVYTPSSATKRAGTEGEESFGLGLSISRQIVEAHGGKIWFESTEGKGTTFFITLNIAA